MICPDCKGTGKIALFTTAKPCANCGGTGKLAEGISAVLHQPFVGSMMTAETRAAWEKARANLDKARKDKP